PPAPGDPDNSSSLCRDENSEKPGARYVPSHMATAKRGDWSWGDSLRLGAFGGALVAAALLAGCGGSGDDGGARGGAGGRGGGSGGGTAGAGGSVAVNCGAGGFIGSAGSLISDGGFECPMVAAGGFTNYTTGQSFYGWTVVGTAGAKVSPLSGAYVNGSFK